MDRLAGLAWLRVAVAFLLVAAPVTATIASASAPAALQIVSQDSEPVVPLLTLINTRSLAGWGALVVAALVLLLYFIRRRLYILFWTAGWVVVATSMIVAGKEYGGWVNFLAYGFSQFLWILSGLCFVVAADAYPTRPHLRRGYAFVLLGLFIWFTLAPISLDARAAAVFAPGHVLIAGALAAAGVAHLLLLRHARLLGAAVVGVSLLIHAGVHVWVVLAADAPGDPEVAKGFSYGIVLYLVAALGMQMMTLEDMMLELRRTNRRLESAQSKLRRMVITDPLTGCRNRRFFDEIIGRELQRHARYGIPLSMLFVDIDRFKAINDTLGHDAGDRVLREVAAFLLANIREADYVFRWGGDEFLILLSCTEEEARRRGASLQEAFASSAARHTLPPGVGLSIGSAEIAPDSRDIMSAVRIADERMYENKRAIRRVH